MTIKFRVYARLEQLQTMDRHASQVRMNRSEFIRTLCTSPCSVDWAIEIARQHRMAERILRERAERKGVDKA